MEELSSVTHYMPRAWHGRAHTPEVQKQLSSMFQLKVGPRLAAPWRAPHAQMCLFLLHSCMLAFKRLYVPIPAVLSYDS